METVKIIIETLEKEILRLNSTIANRKAEIEKAYKEIVDKAEAEKAEAMKEFQSTENEINRLKATLSAAKGEKPKESTTAKAKKGKEEDKDRVKKPLDIPKEYSKDLSYKPKIAYVLANADKPLSRDGIANAIAKLENAKDSRLIGVNVNMNISSLVKDYKGIETEKEGRRILYRLKDN